MPTASHALMRLLGLAFLLLLGSGEDGRADKRVCRDGDTPQIIASANVGAALAATPVATSVRLRPHSVTLQPPVPDPSLYGAAIQCAAAPAILTRSLSSSEPARGLGARPPPALA